MSSAIIRTGGKQFRVEPGSSVRVPLLKQEVGASVNLEALAAADDKETRFRNPLVDGTKVTATVVNHGRAPKIVVFKKKRGQHYKRTKGHPQGYTPLKIEEIA